MLAKQNTVAGILLGLMAVLAGIAAAIGTWLTRDGEMLGETTSAMLYTTPFVLPIAIAAVLGGLAVHRHAWIPALGVSAGLWLGPIGQLTEEKSLFVAGAVLLGAGILGFWVAGWVARFPMWIGVGRSKWVEVQRPDQEPAVQPGAEPLRTWVDTQTPPEGATEGAPDGAAGQDLTEDLPR